jgi:hypothetical protein
MNRDTSILLCYAVVCPAPLCTRGSVDASSSQGPFCSGRSRVTHHHGGGTSTLITHSITALGCGWMDSIRTWEEGAAP